MRRNIQQPEFIQKQVISENSLLRTFCTAKKADANRYKNECNQDDVGYNVGRFEEGKFMVGYSRQ